MSTLLHPKEQELLGSYYLIESKDDYENINNKFYLEGFNFTIKSMNNLDFGSIIQFYITSTEEYDMDKVDNFLENYYLELKSEQYTKAYEIYYTFGVTHEDNVKKLILNDSSKADNNNYYEDNIKQIIFLQGNLIYNNDEVNTNDMQVYIVNKTTGEKILMYSKLNN